MGSWSYYNIILCNDELLVINIRANEERGTRYLINIASKASNLFDLLSNYDANIITRSEPSNQSDFIA